MCNLTKVQPVEQAPVHTCTVRIHVQVAKVYLKTCGECGETSRDLYHSQYGLVRKSVGFFESSIGHVPASTHISQTRCNC